MKQYVCVVPFSVELYDDDGRFTEKYLEIDKGSRWELNERPYRVCSNDKTVRLESADIESFAWLEILPERLTQNFEEIKE